MDFARRKRAGADGGSWRCECTLVKPPGPARPNGRTQPRFPAFPKFFDVAFTNWKHRKPKHRGLKYYIRIWRNYLDVRFCPLSWLLLYVKYLKTEENRTTGRFFKAKHAAFEAMLNHVFANGGFPEGTTHSLRRSTYQWAGRCNAQETEMKLAARHTAQSNSFVKYVADGYADASNFEDAGLPDPIRKMWVWKRATPNKQPYARDFQD